MASYELKAVYKNRRRKAMLYFVDNSKKIMMRNRYDLAKRVIKEGVLWVRTTEEEESAVASLIKWGMLERWPSDPRTVRWAESHARPVFRADIAPLSSAFVRGRLVTRLTEAQKALLDSLEKSGGFVVVEGHKNEEVQRSLRHLQRRGLVVVKHGRYREAPWQVRLQGDILPVTDVLRLELMVAGSMRYDDLLDVLAQKYPHAAASQWKDEITRAVNVGELRYVRVEKGASFEMRLTV